MAKLKSKPLRYGSPDDDIPEMTAADFRRARPIKDALPTLHEAVLRARGRPKKDNPKQHVSLRLDPEVVAGFRAQGPGWQSRINEVLVRALARKSRKKLERRAA
jgi:uncharacterized protein (DUF4415 family)